MAILPQNTIEVSNAALEVGNILSNGTHSQTHIAYVIEVLSNDQYLVAWHERKAQQPRKHHVMSTRDTIRYAVMIDHLDAINASYFH